MISEELFKKIDEDALTAPDIPLYYGLYTKIANSSDIILKDFDKWDATIYFDVGVDGEDAVDGVNGVDGENGGDGGISDHWLKFENGKLSFGMGEVKNPDVIYKLSEEVVLKTLSGTLDTIYNLYNLNLKISGDNTPDIDNFSWIDEQIRGEIRRQIARKKTNLIPKNLFTISKERYFKLAKSLRFRYPITMQAVEDYRLNMVENNTVGLQIALRAEKYPDRIFLQYEDIKYTNREFNEHSNQIANYFKKRGLEKADVVVVDIEDRPEILFTIVGLSKIGAISSLINTRQRKKPLIHSIKHSEGKAFIIGEELIEVFEEVKSELELSDKQKENLFFLSDKEKTKPPEDFINLDKELENSPKNNPSSTKDITQEDPYCYIFTSGTTGLPKAAIITHGQTIGSSFYWGKMIFRVNENDICYITTPLFHSNAINIGFAAAISSLQSGGIAIRRKYSASNFLKDARKFNATYFNYVGEICRYLYNQPSKSDDADNPIIKCAGNGIKDEFWIDFKQRFGIKNIYEQYGATEVSIPNFCNRFGLDCVVGICLSLYTIVKYNIDKDEPIKDENGHMVRVEPGEAGLLLGQINPESHYMYKNSDETNKKVFRNVYHEGDAWVNTGDLIRDIGFRHAKFVDRLGDTYRWHAENVSTEEVENVINAFEQVEVSTAYGVEIPGTEGRAGMVSILKKEGVEFDLKRFLKYIKAYLPDFAVPIFVRFGIPPTTATNKIQKVKLKKQGYNIYEIKDSIYVLLPKSDEYVALTEEIYNGILKSAYRY
ncbi:MAG: long-chain-acyl-CoA synthetase [Promethearchaeota archaeon]